MSKKNNESMKSSILISLLILVVGGVIGWRQEVAHGKVVEIYEEVSSAAEERGVLESDSLTGQAGQGERGRSRREHRKDEARSLAGELVAFMKELQAMQESGESQNEELQEKIFEMMERLGELDGAQMKVLVDELWATSELEDRQRQEIASMAIMMMAQQNPESALALLTESAGKMDLEQMMGGQLLAMVLGNLSRTDPEAALAWIRENAEKNPDLVTKDVKMAVIRGTVPKDVGLAIRLIEEFEVEEDSVAFHLVKGVRTGEQRQALLVALREKGDEKLMSKVMRSMASSLTGEGFEAAQAWMEEAELTVAEQASLSDGISYHWTKEETGKWIEWTGDHGGAQRESRVEHLMREWTKKDYRAAGTWLADAEEGEIKRQAVSSFAQTVAPYEPESAAEWTQTLPRGGKRRIVARNVYEEWKKQDAEAAEIFAREEGLDE